MISIDNAMLTDRGFYSKKLSGRTGPMASIYRRQSIVPTAVSVPCWQCQLNVCVVMQTHESDGAIDEQLQIACSDSGNDPFSGQSLAALQRSRSHGYPRHVRGAESPWDKGPSIYSLGFGRHFAYGWSGVEGTR